MRSMSAIHKKSGTKWGLFVVSALAVLIAGFFLFIFLMPKQGVELFFNAPSTVNLGESTPLEIIFSNNTESSISDVSLSFTLPKGVIFENSNSASRRKDIGVVEAGKSSEEAFQVIVTDGSAESKEIQVTANYLPPTTKKKISIQKNYKFKINKPIETTIKLPDRVVSGELFDWTVKYKNNSEKSVEFTPVFSGPKELKTNFESKKIQIPAGEEISASFTGEVIFPEGKTFDVILLINEEVGDQKILLSQSVSNVLMAPAWLSIKTRIDGLAQDQSVKPGDRLNYIISLRNNADQTMNDVRVNMTFLGSMYDFSTLTGAGQVDKNSGSIYLTGTELPSLRALEPGTSIEIPVAVKVKSEYPINQFGDKNFSLKAKIQVESLSVPKLSRANRTINISELETKVGGRLELKAKAYFRDASSGILNEGDLPLTVGRTTELTVHWILRDLATDMSDIKIAAELPPGVTVTDIRKASIGDFKYDPMVGKVIWTIPQTLASTGVITKPLETVFQVRVTPDASQIGQYMTILGDSAGEAIDSFANTKTYFGAEPITSALPDDKTIGPQDGIVKQ